MAGPAKKKTYLHALQGLRERILTGVLATGDRVSEVALAAELGVSRTPLREAMAELIEQGLLEKSPNGRCVVRSFTRNDVIDTIELRGLVEGLAFRTAAERGADPEALQRCEDIVAQIDATIGQTWQETDFDRYFELNTELHEALNALCGSDIILREVWRVSRMPMAAPSTFMPGQAVLPQTLQSVTMAQDQHRSIIDAIRNHEGSRAEALAREHARLARRTLDYYLYEGRQFADQIPGIVLIDNGRGAPDKE